MKISKIFRKYQELWTVARMINYHLTKFVFNYKFRGILGSHIPIRYRHLLLI